MNEDIQEYLQNKYGEDSLHWTFNLYNAGIPETFWFKRKEHLNEVRKVWKYCRENTFVTLQGKDVFVNEFIAALSIHAVKKNYRVKYSDMKLLQSSLQYKNAVDVEGYRKHLNYDLISVVDFNVQTSKSEEEKFTRNIVTLGNSVLKKCIVVGIEDVKAGMHKEVYPSLYTMIMKRADSISLRLTKGNVARI